MEHNFPHLSLVQQLAEEGIRRPKYGRVSGLYICNDRACRLAQNQSARQLKRWKKVKAHHGIIDWNWWLPTPAYGAKPKRGRHR